MMEDDFQAIAHRAQKLLAPLPRQVRLIGVSKTFSADHIRAAYGAGIRDFGENRVQEALEKKRLLQDLPDITWHLIGHLQSNKVRKAVEHFDWIHSVDSLQLLQSLDGVAADLGKCPNLCLQVKLRDDPQKTGWLPATLLQSLPQIGSYRSIQVKGLMTIPPWGLSSPESQSVFSETRQLAEQLSIEIAAARWSNLRMEELSMGMSEDYGLALAEGTTMIRLGRILFGSRGV
jgi:PLP dependent protein